MLDLSLSLSLILVFFGGLRWSCRGSLDDKEKKNSWTRLTAQTELIPHRGLEMRQGRATDERLELELELELYCLGVI